MWAQAVLATGSGRDINRHKYTNEEAEAALQQPVVKALLDLCKFRNTHQAFMGQVGPPSLHPLVFVCFCQLLLGISPFFLCVLSGICFGQVHAPEAQTCAKLAFIDWKSIQKHARFLLASLSHKTSET